MGASPLARIQNLLRHLDMFERGVTAAAEPTPILELCRDGDARYSPAQLLTRHAPAE
jgi:hypothetical protein